MNRLFEKGSGYVEAPWVEHEPSGFLLQGSSFRLFVLMPVLKKILPKEAFNLFYAQQKKQLWSRVFKRVSAAVGTSVAYRPGIENHTAARYYSYRVFSSESGPYGLFGYGQSLVSGDEALSKALGEYLERRVFSREEFSKVSSRLESVKRVGKAAVQLDGTALFSEEQREKKNNCFVTKGTLRESTFRWVRARPFIGLSSMLVPAQRVFYDYPFLEGEGILNQPSTNGCAGGFSKKQATCSAILELVERDSFLCFWLLKLVPKQIDVRTISSPEVQSLYARVRSMEWGVSFLDVKTALGIPVVATVLTREEGEVMRVAVGTAAGYAPEELFLKSLLEALNVAQGFARDTHEEVQRGASDMSGKISRFSTWRNGVPSKDIEWFFSGERVSHEDYVSHLPKLKDESEAFRLLKKAARDWVREYGEAYRPHIYVSKSKILRQLHYSVVAAVVPGLHPFYLKENFGPRDISSMAHWKETLSSFGGGGDVRVKNNTPHPLP